MIVLPTYWHLSFLLPMFFFAACLSGQVKTEKEILSDIYEKCRRLRFEHPDSAIMLSKKGISLAEMIGDSNTLGNFHLLRATVFSSREDWDKTIKDLFKAKNAFVAAGNRSKEAYTYLYMGTYANIKDEDKEKLFKKAIVIQHDIYDMKGLTQSLINFGNFYVDNGHWDTAISYFKEAYKIAEINNYSYELPVATTNIACYYAHKGDYTKALSLLRQALQLMPSKYQRSIAGIEYDIMETFFKAGDYDSVMFYFNRIKNEADIRSNIRIDAYRLLSELHTIKGDHEQALIYFRKADSIREDVKSKSNENLLTLMELEYDSEAKKRQLTELGNQIEKERLIRISLISILIISLLFTAILIIQQKEKSKRKGEALLQKKRRAEAERKLLRTELKNSELQRQFLNDELKFTNKELSSFAASIVKNSDLLKDLKDCVDNILKEKDTKKVKAQLSELKVRLVQLFNDDEQRREFVKRSQQINHSLIFYLKTSFPQLNDSDINLLILLLLKFSSKEISVLYNIETDSVVKRRYRLRKKIGLENRDSFETFFKEVTTEFDLAKGLNDT